MEIRLLENDKENRKLSFVLKGSTAVFANLLRRYMIEKVPTMAIEDVEFKENTCILYDEILAHRLGLVPLTTDLKSYNMISKCKCKGKGCNRCTLKLTLKADKPGYVYASSIKSKDPKVKPVYPNMPVAKLLKNQEIELLATAVLGQGCDHVKFSPGFVFYNYKTNIIVNNKSSKFEEFKNSYPPQIFDKKGQIDRNLINTPNLVDACDGLCDDIVKVEHDNTSFIFYIESWGQLSCKEMAVTSMDMFKQDLEEFENLLKKA